MIVTWKTRAFHKIRCRPVHLYNAMILGSLTWIVVYVALS